MITVEQIKAVTAEYFSGKEIFLVDVRVRTGNVINVFIDGDHGVLIDDCIQLSRFIEAQFDREVEDYELSVSTAGLDKPLLLLRQYPRNIGRTVEVSLKDGTIHTGKLISVGDDHVVVDIPAPKKKVEAQLSGPLTLPFSEIKGTKVMISFK
jgi:ribosome maturation factor RimP